jgi:hypothetical protein
MNFLILNDSWAETKLSPCAQCTLDLLRPDHSTEPAWAVRPTTGLGPWARLERVPWHDSRWFTGGYPMTKLCTDVDPSDGVLPGTAWPKAAVVDRPCRGPHGMQRVAWRCHRQPMGRCPREAFMDLGAPS